MSTGSYEYRNKLSAIVQGESGLENFMDHHFLKYTARGKELVSSLRQQKIKFNVMFERS